MFKYAISRNSSRTMGLFHIYVKTRVHILIFIGFSYEMSSGLLEKKLLISIM